MSFIRYPQLARLSRRSYSSPGASPPPPPSPHASLYSSTFPAMIPVFLLGSAVYLGLQLAQLNLAHEKHMDEALSRVHALEAEIDALQSQRAAHLNAPAGPVPQPAPRVRWW